jgi:uncharacterized membrane protein
VVGGSLAGVADLIADWAVLQVEVVGEQLHQVQTLTAVAGLPASSGVVALAIVLAPMGAQGVVGLIEVVVPADTVHGDAFGANKVVVLGAAGAFLGGAAGQARLFAFNRGLRAFALAQKQAVVASGTVGISGPVAFLATGVARVAGVVHSQILAVNAVGTVVGSGAAAGHTAVVARRTVLLVKAGREINSQPRAILANAVGSASSGVVALTIAGAMAGTVGVAVLVIIIIETDAVDASAIDDIEAGGAVDTVVGAGGVAGQAAAVAGDAFVVLVVGHSALGVALGPADVVLQGVGAVAGQAIVVGDIEAGFAGLVAGSADVVLVIEVPVGLVAGLHAFAGSQNVSGVTSQTLIIAGTRAGGAGLIARQALALREIEPGLAGVTIGGLGASAGVALIGARRADGVGVGAGVKLDQRVAVLALAVGRASSGAVALAIAAAEVHDGLVEDVFVVHAFHGQAFAELQEVVVRAGDAFVIVGA